MRPGRAASPGGLKLVAGGKDGYNGPSNHRHLLDAEGGEDTYLPRSEDGAPFEDFLACLYVFAGGADVHAEGLVDQDADFVHRVAAGLAIDFVGILEGDDGVTALGRRCAGHDAEGSSRFNATVGNLPGGNEANNPQDSGTFRGSVPHVLVAEGIAVHSRVVGRRDVQGRKNVLSQGLSQYVQDGSGLRLQRAEGGDYPLECILYGEHISVVVAAPFAVVTTALVLVVVSVVFHWPASSPTPR